MTETIAVPLWLLLVLLVFAGWMALVRVLVPSVRWFFRRKVNQAIDEMNQRLRIQVRPFKLNRRQVLIDRLSYDPEVLEAAERWAKAERVPNAVAIARVRRYATEICPSFNAYMYFGIGNWIARRLVRMLYWVRVVYADKQGFIDIDAHASLVFVLNHRSNIDYLLATYMVVHHAALSYAVGEWARVWPLQQLIRSMGAYFVRRGSGDPLYRKVLSRYVHMAIEGGIIQAVFPEGGLSRDGRIRPPKLSLLDYMVRAFDPAGERDVVFIPVGINYDRVLEDRSLLLESTAPRQKPGRMAALRTTVEFVAKIVRLKMQNRWDRFGYAVVQFGSPISLRQYCQAADLDFRHGDADWRFARVTILADHLMAAVGELVPALSVPLLARVVRAGLREFTELELKAEVQGCLDALSAPGRRHFIFDAANSFALDKALRMMVIRHLLIEREGRYRANPDETRLIEYYARSIDHLFTEAA
ncbi:MAG: glycerol-3-phosphate acyltransferase [Proteobacteria bacterium]|nr:MAG: glycerol-3-phosphate acyltransferase [Pseudomonadota bacterium]